jgi:hypothetical protein
MDIVDVEDILRVYQSAPKIVEVEKVVEKVVEKLVHVPHYYSMECKQTDVVPLNKI